MTSSPLTETSTQWSIDPVRRAIRRRWLIIVACIVVTPLCALGVSLAQTTEYTAKASLLLESPNFDQILFDTQAASSSSQSTRNASTMLELLGQEIVAKQAAQNLGIPTSEVRHAVSVGASPKSDILTVRATDENASRSAHIANAYAQAFIEIRQAADRVTLEAARTTLLARLDAMSPTDRASRTGQALTEQANQLDLMRSLQTGDAELTQPALVPKSPSSPNTPRNVILGLLFGILLAIGFTALAERLDRRIRDPEEARSIFAKPLLSVVPRFRSLNVAHPSSIELDPFAMLRLNLSYYNIDSPVRRVLLTSALQGDGKTTVAWLLAVASAASDSRVVIIDADLRRPTLADRAGVLGQPGLSDLLSGGATLEEITQTAMSTGTAGSHAGRRVDVIAAGGIPPNPGELINSARMGQLLRDLSDAYDLVIVDTPPITLVPDAIPLISQVDGTIVVARVDRTTRDAASRLKSQLDNLDARLLGVVANSVDLRSYGSYGYGYGYGYATVPGEAPGAHKNGAQPEPPVSAVGDTGRRGD